MEDDDVSNNSYYMPREPVEQEIARKEEKASTLESKKVLEDLIQRLNDRIAFYESVSSIPDDVRVEPDKFLIMHNSHTLAARALKGEREYIASLLDTHIR